MVMAGRAAFCCHLIDGNTHGRLGHREWRLRCRGASLHFTDIPGIFVASSYVVVVLRRRFNIWDRATSSWFFQTIFRAIPHSTKIDTHIYTYIRDGRKLVLEWLSLSLLFSFKVVVMAWFFSSRRKPLRKPLRKPTSILAPLWIKTAGV